MGAVEYIRDFLDIDDNEWIEHPIAYSYSHALRFTLGEGDIYYNTKRKIAKNGNCKLKVTKSYRKSITNKVLTLKNELGYRYLCIEFLEDSAHNLFKNLDDYVSVDNYSMFDLICNNEVDDTFRLHVGLAVVDMDKLSNKSLEFIIGRLACSDIDYKVDISVSDLILIPDRKSPKSLLIIYDDKGMDLVCDSEDKFLELAEKYRTWISDYDFKNLIDV